MPKISYKTRRTIGALVSVLAVIGIILLNPSSYEKFYTRAEEEDFDAIEITPKDENAPLALDVLEKLAVKGRAPKTGYSREKFYDTWPNIEGCSLRQHIIKRELGDTAVISKDDNCSVISGEYDEPYTGSHLIFYQKSDLSNGVQIDHVVALSDAWQKGAQNLTADERYKLATDPLNLLAVEAKANQNKSDGDAATWLPPNKAFRCAYVARQVSVKYKYNLWVTEAEKSAIERILSKCPNEPAVGVEL